jgi:hypothetical protein
MQGERPDRPSSDGSPVSAPADLEDLKAFRKNSRLEQERLAKLLACRRRFGLLPNSKGAQLANVRWTSDVVDAEFRKNVQIFCRLIAGAVGICERERVRRMTQAPSRNDPGADKPEAAHGDDGDAAQPHSLLARLDDLQHLITLPSDIPLTLEAVLGRRFELEQTLLELGDDDYVRSRAADLYDEGRGTLVTWRDLFGEVRPPLLADVIPRSRTTGSGGSQRESGAEGAEGGGAWSSATVPDTDDDPTSRTRRMLARLLAVKQSTYLPLRARRELKQRVLFTVVVPWTLLLTALFAVAIGTVDDEEDAFLLAAVAGAAGAALGGLIKLRDEISRGAEMREFAPFFLGQIIVGAAAGLLAFVTARAGIIELGAGTSGLAAFGFVVGFSEAAFLGIVGRIAGGLGEREKDGAETEPVPKSPSCANGRDSG